MKRRKTKKVRISRKVAATIGALRASFGSYFDCLGSFRCGIFQDLADTLAANGCSIEDLQKAALILDEQLLWERQLFEIEWRLTEKKVPLPETFTYEELLTIAAASGDHNAQAMIDGKVIAALQTGLRSQ